MRLTRVLALLAIAMLWSASGIAQSHHDYLANNVLLIVRHAEKPDKSNKSVDSHGLTPQGEARARAYVDYFQHFHDGDLSFAVDGLYAGADSEESMRPRLTLEPLHTATGMPLHSDIGTKDNALLVKELHDSPHGTHPLIAWRHGQIPALLEAFGASKTLIPDGKWPDDVYDWVVILSFDANGKLTSQRLIHEDLKISLR